MYVFLHPDDLFVSIYKKTWKEHSDIFVTINVYTHVGFDVVEEEFRKAQVGIEKRMRSR